MEGGRSIRETLLAFLSSVFVGLIHLCLDGGKEDVGVLACVTHPVLPVVERRTYAVVIPRASVFPTVPHAKLIPLVSVNVNSIVMRRNRKGRNLFIFRSS